MKKAKAILTAAVFILILAVVFSIIPCWTVTGRSYTCRICAASRDTVTTRIFGMPVRSKRSGVESNELTDIYDKYIGEQHEHEWAGGAFWQTYGSLLGAGSCRDGVHGVKPYSLLQPQFTRIALSAVEQVQEWAKERRISLYYAIRDCNDVESLHTIKETFKEAKQGKSEELWENWLQSKQELEQRVER